MIIIRRYSKIISKIWSFSSDLMLLNQLAKAKNHNRGQEKKFLKVRSSWDANLLCLVFKKRHKSSLYCSVFLCCSGPAKPFGIYAAMLVGHVIRISVMRVSRSKLCCSIYASSAFRYVMQCPG